MSSTSILKFGSMGFISPSMSFSSDFKSDMNLFLSALSMETSAYASRGIALCLSPPLMSAR